MLKKIYQKNGLILIFDTNEEMEMEFCYFIMNNYKKDKSIDKYKKEYYKQKGIIYPQLN